MSANKLTDSPPAGAGPSRVRVIEDGLPPTRDAGVAVIPLSFAGTRVNAALFVLAPFAAVTLSVSDSLTGTVPMLNVALVAPDCTTASSGVTTSVPEAVRCTLIPDGPAVWEIETVPLVIFPLVMDAGSRLSPVTCSGITDSDADFVIPPNVAEMVGPYGVEFWTVVTANWTLFEPAGTVTLCGVVTAAWFDDARVTVAPPVGAGPSRLTTPATGVAEPPTTGLGVTAKLLSWARRTVRMQVRVVI